MDDEARQLQLAVEAIESYLARHPAAADSEVGIAQWWLRAEGVEVPLAVVRAALQILCERGVLEQVPLPGGKVAYRSARPQPP